MPEIFKQSPVQSEAGTRLGAEPPTPSPETRPGALAILCIVTPSFSFWAMKGSAGAQGIACLVSVTAYSDMLSSRNSCESAQIE